MTPKVIIAIVLVAIIIGGFIFLQVRKKRVTAEQHSGQPVTICCGLPCYRRLYGT